MKRGILISIGLLMLVLYINGCGINDRGVDPGLENDPAARFHAHDHQRGEGFGFFNQQRDRKNPIANMVTRDERPGRGMNGILDRRPPEMNQRISRFEATEEQNDLRPGPKAFSSQSDDNLPEQITLELLQMEMVRDVRVISYHNQLLVAVECETNDTNDIKNEISQLITDKYPNKEIIVVTDRRAVDRIRMLDDGLQRGQTEDNNQQFREFFDDTTGPIAGH
ncbi:YhcN/YlaJ family sporulation lipoprotein [Anaerobacillus isosaccharinicus]|uniref:YhcN/YlaJ family sporulation lipoprotein n=1 Tax=Anaerobacillus isosaccharinicus TaxID=1532552 RepID=A0A7S7RAG4_9BACI|nr:YhcN/YlaJ family sporulation lipoprotein [Anaerobacillus isosaccharinicus]MBA5586974.1 YhcN/YlaJ family sporulation lipoprotein [Anaerobacillus isosaccharinicus]QOY34822.1 YhcN/YlaJ family sporulation lipoprotein [Anaerobacillus isosaccharinicus]